MYAAFESCLYSGGAAESHAILVCVVLCVLSTYLKAGVSNPRPAGLRISEAPEQSVEKCSACKRGSLLSLPACKKKTKLKTVLSDMLCSCWLLVIFVQPKVNIKMLLIILVFHFCTW